jgi:PAS domain S-box-containing protein
MGIDMQVPLEHPVGEEIESLQRCLNDLISILALPAMWSGAEPQQIANTLLDALLKMLRLEVVYVRLNDPSGGEPIEMVRESQSRQPAHTPQEFGALLRRRLGDDPRSWPARRNSLGDGDIAVVPLPVGLYADGGAIVAGSRRADFPRPTERLLLGVAANQAAIGLQEARLLSEQKRTARELDQRVAQRAGQLAAAIDELQLRVSMLQHLPVAAWSVQPDGTPDIVGQGWYDYTGQTPEYVNSHPEAWMSTIHAEDRDRAAKSYWEGIHSGRGFTMEARFLRARDRTYRWHLNRAVPVRDGEGNIVRFVGTSTDVEDLKRAQERITENEFRLSQMIETIPAMVWRATAEGALDYCNARVVEYTGFSREDVMGIGWTQIIHPDDVEQVVRTWKSCVANGTPYQMECRLFRAADRKYRWFMTSALPLRNPQGRIVNWYGTVVELHDWKQAQEELRNTQAELAYMARVMTVGELTASIAHEVNQPLAGIVTNANACMLMLGADPPNVDGARETARRTIRDASRASEVVKRLRALFARKDIAPESVDLNEAAAEVIALCNSTLRRNQVLLRTELAEDLPPVTGDRVQLQQVILNLLTNASDAMNGVADRQRQILLKTELEAGDRVRVTVRDTGIGFNPRDKDKLFAAFYSTKSGGMGIGLSVSRSIVESHQGHLWAGANAGPGATFAFSIPRTLQEPPPEYSEPDAPVQVPGVRTVLRHGREP